VTQADEVVGLVRDVLGDDVVGAYQHGSAVLGGLRPRSDIDVLVVSRRRTTAAERQALVNRLLADGRDRSVSARPVELTIVVQSDVRPWRYPPHSEFQYGEWMREELERGGSPPTPTPSPDLAPLITMTLLGNHSLFGPPPAELLDSVPHEDLRRAIVEGVPDLLADLDSDTRNVLLTLARVWTTLATGAITTKDAAADWSLARLPPEHRSVLARARAIYLGEEEEEGWDDLRSRVRLHAEYVVREIDRESRRGPHESAK
jgi:predicted nucleotidyltransferase